jgi:short-subunit dehydrogenase
MLHSVYGFLKYLTGKGTGGILLMSSLAGLWGTQLVASYGATKAFTLNLAEALYHELKDQDIDIMACIAGPTATPAYLSTRPKYGFIKPKVMNPQHVANYAISQLGKRAYCIPGFSNKLTHFLMTRILPRTYAARLMNNTMGKMYN